MASGSSRCATTASASPRRTSRVCSAASSAAATRAASAARDSGCTSSRRSCRGTAARCASSRRSAAARRSSCTCRRRRGWLRTRSSPRPRRARTCRPRAVGGGARLGADRCCLVPVTRAHAYAIAAAWPTRSGRPMSPRPLPLLLLLACLPCACKHGSSDAILLRASSMSPPPGAFAVSRRVEARVALDTDVDPASISAATCRVERVDGGGPEATTQTYDQAARLLTIAPVHALAPFTAYRVRLGDLRAANGVPFANEVEWSFTTDGMPVWERSAALAPGRLLACEPSRRGGVLVVWEAPDRMLQCARGDGAGWSSAVEVGITDAYLADVADDTRGRDVVAANTPDGSLHVATAAAGFVFGPAETVATTVFAHV